MDNIKDAALMIKDADALLISASNGLSISEGFNIFADNQIGRASCRERV